MNTDFEAELYGRGLRFPFQFDEATGGIAKESGPELVRENLVFILNTNLRERFMAPTFGSQINNALFMLDVEQQRDVLRGYVEAALAQEPRIETIGSVEIVEDKGNDHALQVNITFRLINQANDNNVIISLLRGTDT